MFQNLADRVFPVRWNIGELERSQLFYSFHFFPKKSRFSWNSPRDTGQLPNIPDTLKYRTIYILFKIFQFQYSSNLYSWP